MGVRPGGHEDFGTTPADELDRILAKHPKLIVVGVLNRGDLEYVRKLSSALASQYEYLKTIDHVELYRLRAFSAAPPQPSVP